MIAKTSKVGTGKGAYWRVEAVFEDPLGSAVSVPPRTVWSGGRGEHAEVVAAYLRNAHPDVLRAAWEHGA